MSLPWDDLPLFLAAWRERSLGRAAASLGMSTSTASRRLAALEATLGAPLFLRTPDGLAPTSAAKAILPSVEAMERASQHLQVELAGLDQQIEGVVRVALDAELACFVILPSLKPLLDRHPGLRLELLSGTELVDLNRREADMALRLVRPTSGDGLMLTRLREVRQVPFAHPRLLREWSQHGELQRLPWIGWTEGHLYNPLHRWMSAALPDVDPQLRLNDFYLVRRAAQLGLGATLLPFTFGSLAPPLVELPVEDTTLALPTATLWLVGLRALRDTPRYALVWDFLVELLRPLPGQDDLAILKPLQEA